MNLAEKNMSDTCVPFRRLRSLCPAQASLLLCKKGVFFGLLEK